MGGIKLNYPKKYVGFMDLLGFSSFVEQASYEDVKSLMCSQGEEINWISEINKKYFSHERARIFQVSDSVIFLYPENSAMGLIEDFLQLQAYAGMKGWFFRGGITYGDVDDFDGNVVGPAFIKSYLLESERARKLNIPAVLLEEDTYKEICREENANYIKECIKLDKQNKVYYIDIFSHNQNLYLHLPKTKEQIILGLNKNLNQNKIYEKYKWLAKEFNNNLSYINDEVRKLKIKGLVEGEITPIQI